MTEEAKNPNITREGILVEPGQIWQDLDARVTKRHGGTPRTVEITRVADGKAHYAGKKGEKHISIKRMYKHGAGFELLGKKIGSPAKEAAQ